MVTRGRTASTAGASASRSPSTSSSSGSASSGKSASSSASTSSSSGTASSGHAGARSSRTSTKTSPTTTTTTTPTVSTPTVSRGVTRFSDPSVLSGLITNPFSEIGQAIYGPISDFGEAVQETIVEPVTEFLSPITEPITDIIFPEEEVPIVPEEEVPILPEVTCPARVQIVSNITNVVAGEGLFNCATIDRYEDDPDYRIIYLDTEEGIPTEEPEPDVPEQMQFLCSDVYTLDAGRVVKTSYPTLSVSQIQNFINQGLMIRDCGTPSPTVNEVRSHYGYVPEVPVEEEPVGPEVETTADIPPPTVEEPEVPVVTVPTEKFVVSKPGRLTMSDMTNTNAWVGILIAGTLAVPVFSSILSKKK